jgi:solute carrier family 8 (sodium/calcium exchanger)
MNEIIEIIDCLLHIENCITGLILVSVGTSIPDIVTTLKSASNPKSHNCDDVFIPVVAANAANIFIGLGLPWTISSIHREYNGNGAILLGRDGAFDMFFAIVTFLVGSTLAYIIFVIRRGCLHLDLGGSNFSKFCSSFFLFLIWIVFLALNIANCYGYFGETFMPW